MPRRRIAAIALATALPLSVASTGVASATDYPPPPPPSYGGGDEGCTPGYWKNHLGAWDYYTPNQTLGSVFDAGALGSLSSRTLLQALSFGGGSSLTQAKQILLRAAVAALLNATDDVVEYELSRTQVINQVNTALASNDRATILNLATRLDRFNNAGCPL